MARSLRSNGKTRQLGAKAQFAHPSYPQDKGKVERCIQNLNREFINPLRKFSEWLKGKIGEYKDWVIIYAFTEEQKRSQQTSTNVTLES
jgi:transposase